MVDIKDDFEAFIYMRTNQKLHTISIYQQFHLFELNSWDCCANRITAQVVALGKPISLLSPM